MKKSLGRPNLGKTETIKQRAVTVYLPTDDMLQEWKAEAALHGAPVSRFVYEVVDNAIRKNSTGVTPREELERRLNDALAEVKSLKERLELAESSLKQADVTVATYRAKISTALPASFDKAIMRKIASLFLERQVVRLDELPISIGVKPDDAKGMAKIRDCLKFLTASDLIEENMSEGRWKAGTGSRYEATGKIRGPK
jgi:hypothetical protein